MTETTDSAPEGQPESDPAKPEAATSGPATTEVEDEPEAKKRAALRETVILADRKSVV